MKYICPRGHFYKGEENEACPECNLQGHTDLEDAINEADDMFEDFDKDEDKFYISILFSYFNT